MSAVRYGIPAGPLRDYELAFLHSGGVLIRRRAESFLLMWLVRPHDGPGKQVSGNDQT